MEENHMKQQKYLTVVVSVEEPEGTLENMIFVESVLERKQMLENFQEYENQVGSIKKLVLVS